MSDSVRPHRRQPTRLCRPWDSPGNNTGVGCHCLLHCVKVKSESEVAQSPPTRSDPMDCSLPGSSILGIFQARVLEWLAIAFSVKRTINSYFRSVNPTICISCLRSASSDPVAIQSLLARLSQASGLVLVEMRSWKIMTDV